MPAQEAGALIGAPGRIPGRWIDRFAGSDPGLNRFRMALEIVLMVAVTLGAEARFVQLTHALQVQAHGAAFPAAEAAKAAAANYGFLVLATVLGGLVALFAGFGIIDTTARGQLISMLVLPVPLIGGLALGIALGGPRLLSLVFFAVLVAAGAYGRRFGPRGFIAGISLFVGDLIGFTVYTAVTLGDVGWLAAEIGVGAVVAIAVRFAFFYPSRAGALQRTQRSYAARTRKVAALALELLEQPRHAARDARYCARDARRLHRQLVRLNEAALMIDAQLADPGAAAGGSPARLLHQRLFDAELALANIARFAQAMARFALPVPYRFEARLALRDLVCGENERARVMPPG